MKTEVLHVAAGVVWDKTGRVLIALRHNTAHQGGLWEFPGGKLEPGESVEQALSRELKEELDISVQKLTPLIKTKHQYSDLKVQLDVWTVLDFAGKATGLEGQKIQWVFPEQLKQYSFPEANKPIITAVRLADEYAILNAIEEKVLVQQFNTLLERGVKLIQARIKLLPEDAVIRFFEWAMPLCQEQGVQLLLNSAVNGANKVHANGLHLTASDMLALTQKPENYAWIAASCHNALELQYAESIGIDFVVLAPVLSTTTHPDAKPLGWTEFKRLTEMTNLPVFALGGLERKDKIKAKMAGAIGIAGISTFLSSKKSQNHQLIQYP